MQSPAAAPATPNTTPQALHRLQAWIQQQQRRDAPRIVSSGWRELDRLLPSGGLRRGTLVEWLAGQRGSGAGLLATIAAIKACRERGPLVVVDRRRWFNPLPALALGIPLANLLIVHPRNSSDETWAIDQALRSRAVGGVIAWPDRLDGHTFRRLQLAAETSGAIGCLVRPAAARGDPTWADLRLLVRGATSCHRWRLDVELVRCHGGRQGGAASLYLDELTGASHETHPLSVVSELADPAARANPIGAERRSAGAL